MHTNHSENLTKSPQWNRNERKAKRMDGHIPWRSWSSSIRSIPTASASASRQPAIREGSTSTLSKYQRSVPGRVRILVSLFALRQWKEFQTPHEKLTECYTFGLANASYIVEVRLIVLEKCFINLIHSIEPGVWWFVSFTIFPPLFIWRRAFEVDEWAMLAFKLLHFVWVGLNGIGEAWSLSFPGNINCCYRLRKSTVFRCSFQFYVCYKQG